MKRAAWSIIVGLLLLASTNGLLTLVYFTHTQPRPGWLAWAVTMLSASVVAFVCALVWSRPQR